MNLIDISPKLYVYYLIIAETNGKIVDDSKIQRKEKGFECEIEFQIINQSKYFEKINKLIRK